MEVETNLPAGTPGETRWKPGCAVVPYISTAIVILLVLLFLASLKS